MKTVVAKIVCALALASTWGGAQEQGESFGWFCIINAVDDDGSMMVTVDGKPTSDTGYVAGEFSGLLGHRPGRAKLEAKMGELLPVEAPLPLGKDDRVWLVFYKALLQKENQPEPVPALQVLAAPEAPKRERGYHVSTLLVGSTVQTVFSVSGQSVQLQPGKATEVALKGARLEVEHAGKTLAGRDLESPGNFLLVLFPRGETFEHILIYL